MVWKPSGLIAPGYNWLFAFLWLSHYVDLRKRFRITTRWPGLLCASTVSLYWPYVMSYLQHGFRLLTGYLPSACLGWLGTRNRMHSSHWSKVLCESFLGPLRRKQYHCIPCNQSLQSWARRFSNLTILHDSILESYAVIWWIVHPIHWNENTLCVWSLGMVCGLMFGSASGKGSLSRSFTSSRALIWYVTRFGITDILEFYGATEGIGGFFNYNRNDRGLGAVGQHGLLMRLLNRRAKLIKVDPVTETPWRGKNGFCAEVSNALLARKPDRELKERTFPGGIRWTWWTCDADWSRRHDTVYWLLQERRSHKQKDPV